jgi:hypothetical protein
MALGVSCSKDPGSVGSTENGGGLNPMAGGAGDGTGQGGVSGRPGGASGFSGIRIDTDASLPSAGGQGGAPPPSEEVNCGISQVETKKLPADLLLVLDRSNSMKTEMGGTQECATGSTTCTSRWKAITDAVAAVLPATQDAVSWGLKFFGSSSNGCDVSDAVDVAPGEPAAASKIASAIGSNKIFSGTPTSLVMEKVGKYMSGLADPNPKYILLATDGQPYCGGARKDQPDDDNAVGSIKSNAFDKGVKVFVVGIAIDDATVATLNRMADAGGTGSYYPVDSPDALKNALQKISGIVASCTFGVQVRLDAGRPDPQNIAVFLDGERLPNDQTDGWVLTNNDTEVELKGKYCEAIKSGTSSTVQVLVGCAPIPAGTIP